jgi:predicted acylesterase/phospholipase RssA
MLRALAFALVTPLASGCALERPTSLSCPAFVDARPLVAETGQGIPADPIPRAMQDTVATMAAAEAEIAAALRAEIGRSPGRDVTFQVVTLSAGGQFGAFGAGFLTGWSENPVTPRPDFNLVTGVSAGATLAPVAFAGPAFDPLLAFWRGADRDRILRLRPLPAWLVAPGLASPAPLEAFLSEALNPPLLGAVAAGHDDGRRLLVGAANLDTGAGEVFDLGAAAAQPGGAPCLREAILASAAIPALFPPRQINGALYADGGLREQVFLRAVEEARTDVTREMDAEVTVEAYLIVNGALRPPPGPVPDRLTSYTLRALDVLADEVLRDSIEEAVAFAESRPGWRLRGIRADLPADRCPAVREVIGGFDPCLTEALFDHGRAIGRSAPIDWLDAAELRALAAEL